MHNKHQLACRPISLVQPDVPSMRHSFTISHSRFMSASGRYLHVFACSNHSSGPAPLERRAGPGWGTSLSLGAMFKIVRRCRRQVQRLLGRRFYGRGRSNGGTARLGRVTVGVLRRDVAAGCGLMERRAQRSVAGCNGRRAAMGGGERQRLGSTSSSGHAR
jgi:hypothetical protein